MNHYTCHFPCIYRGQVVQEYGGLYVVLGYNMFLDRTLWKL